MTVQFLREAFRALENNLRPVLLYCAVALLLGAIHIAVVYYVFNPMEQAGNTDWLPLYTIGLLIALSAVGALADSVFLAQIGREVDKPMWRVSNDADAVRLFYGLWLFLRLINLAYSQFVQLVATDTSEAFTQVMFILSYLVLATVIVAFGAAVMFYGRVRTEEISQAFATLSHHPGPIALIILVGTVFGYVILDLMARLPVFAVPLVSILDGFVTCLIFAFTWLVCVYHRDHFEHDEDDFDF